MRIVVAAAAVLIGSLGCTQSSGGGPPGSGGVPSGAAGTAGGSTGAGGAVSAAGTGGAARPGEMSGAAGAPSAAGGAPAEAGIAGSPDAGPAPTGAGGTNGTGGTGHTAPRYFLGADITNEQPAGVAAINDLLASMKTNGFNFVRLRTFVDPKAPDGYDRTNGYADIAHTAAFGKIVKDAGMGLLVDFHMSDNWADPGKQCVPVSWQAYTNIGDLANALGAYVRDAITTLIAAGSRPDMVQIGNETTPGMLLHICDANGQPTATAGVPGAASAAGWPSLGMLLKAGGSAVKAVDPTILVSFHIDKGSSYAASKDWLDNAIKQGAIPDAFGESCYQRYQGDPNSQANTQNGWQSTFSALATAYPQIRFFAAEYGPMERQINDVLFALPNDQGLGTFNWEPATQGDWNAPMPSDPAGTTTHALWRRSGNDYGALPDLALYPLMKAAYAGRL